LATPHARRKSLLLVKLDRLKQPPLIDDTHDMNRIVSDTIEGQIAIN